MMRWLFAVFLVVLSLSAACAQTKERAGTTGEIGKTYTLGKEQPLYFTLKSAEYSAVRVSIGDEDYVPTKDEKLLVIRYSLQNPRKDEEVSVDFESVHFTVVDAENENHEYVDAVGLEGKGGNLEVNLKPAQKTECYTVFIVPAKGVVPKLIVLPIEDNAPVLRYDLRGKVKALEAPYVDPKDKLGANALGEIAAQPATWYAAGNFDLRLDKVEFSTAKIPDDTLEADHRYLLFTLTLKNKSARERDVDFQTPLKVSLQLEDGGEVEWNERLVLGSSFRDVEQTLKPGKELAVRVFFQVPNDGKLKSFTAYESGFMGDGDKESRSYLFDVSAVK